MKLKRVMIAAPKSGSGKTTITCALLQALKDMGGQVVSYKCGPDYIDPMFHEKVIGLPSKNLDTYFTDEQKTKELLLKNRTEEEYAVLEGVMGLYDGLGGVREEGSSYHLAKVTGTPVILVVDAKGMGYSILPLLAGFLAYDKEHLIRGVILNRMSKAYYGSIAPLIEEELKINVLGYFPEHKEFCIESRHLGLVLPEELEHIRAQLHQAAEELKRTVSLEAILRVAESAREFEEEESAGHIPTGKDSMEKVQISAGKEYKEKQLFVRPVIAVARDEAFCFYYADNLRLLEEYGAELKFFSPIHDVGLPDGCHALLLGGGYPELYADRLSKNVGMRAAIQKAAEQGMPIVAECGGFMYLHSAIRKDEESYDMAGVIPAVCSDSGRLVRFGYIELREKKSSFLPTGERIKGHEFHYYDSTENGTDCLAVKPVTGREYPCVMEGENYWFGFPHLYYPSNPAFAERFVEKAADFLHNRL